MTAKASSFTTKMRNSIKTARWLTEADDNGKHGELVGKGVEKLPQQGDFVEAPGRSTVQHVGEGPTGANKQVK